jgi:aspartate carbamoyltransferase regulatory subunit
MNNPRLYEMKCPNPSCPRNTNKPVNLHSGNLPFERVHYVQLDISGREVASSLFYRCRYCGREFIPSSVHTD